MLCCCRVAAAPLQYQGTLNLIAAAKRAGVKRFVFVTSIGADDPFNPLNLFWGVSRPGGGGTVHGACCLHVTFYCQHIAIHWYLYVVG